MVPAIESNSRSELLSTIKGLQSYSVEMNQRATRRSVLFSRMHSKHQRLARSVGYVDRLHAVDKCMKTNIAISSEVAKLAVVKFNVTATEMKLMSGTSIKAAPTSRVIELLKHFLRDWSEQGSVERTVTFSPILDRLKSEFGDSVIGKKVLVPGAGVGRLAYDISELGFSTTANEFSYLMHLGMYYVLDLEKDSRVFYPSLHSFSYQRSETDQMRVISFPDVTPKWSQKNGAEARLTIDYADFMKYSDAHSYDAIATLFFIDTAANMLSYIEKIHELLKPNGLWINCGPLKYGSAPNVEFTTEEIMKILPRMGFQLEDHWTTKAEYVAESESLWQGIYGIEGWVARRQS
ncbi:N2227-like protein-domain-containing protein [Dipodascopsis uninucleata]